jgi:hypothetical protein
MVLTIYSINRLVVAMEMQCFLCGAIDLTLNMIWMSFPPTYIVASHFMLWILGRHCMDWGDTGDDE